MLLGDPQADIGRSRRRSWRPDAPRSSCRQHRRRWPARRRSALPAPISTRRAVIAALQAARAISALRPASGRSPPCRSWTWRCRPDDRPVAGAAAEIARQRLSIRRVASAPASRHATARRATSRSPACRSRIASRGSRPSPAAPDAAPVRRRAGARRHDMAAVEHAERSRMQALTALVDQPPSASRRPPPCRRRNRPRRSLPWCPARSVSRR